MRLYQQLILIMLAATVLPLAAVGFSLLSKAETELTQGIVSEQRLIAEATAESVSGELMKTVDALARSAELFDWEHISPAEFRGGFKLLYGQAPAVSAVLWLHARGGPPGEAPLPVEDARGRDPRLPP